MDGSAKSEAYYVIRPYLVPLIVSVEAHRFGVTLLRNIDTNKMTSFRSIAPGGLHLQWGNDGYVIISTDYRNQPIWFRASSDERFEHRVEQRNIRREWLPLQGSFEGLHGDYQFTLPRPVLELYQTPWS